MKDSTKRWLMFWGSVLLLKPIIDIRKNELKEFELLKGEKDRFEITLIQAKSRLLAQREIIDLCFDMHGDWAVGDFPALKANLQTLWKLLAEYDPDRRQKNVAERLKPTFEETFK
jgi:hypothetical protein